MGRKRHTPEQIITALREAEVGLARGKSVKLISRELGITEQTYYRWRREYGGMKVSQARRLKELERENGRLKRAVADLTPVVSRYLCKRARARPSWADRWDSRGLSKPLAGEVARNVERTAFGVAHEGHACVPGEAPRLRQIDAGPAPP